MKVVLAILRNKYFLVTTGFLIWIIFFAEYDLVTQFRQRRELNDMQHKIQYLEAEIRQLQTEKMLLKTDSNTVEKYAREKYFMKHPDEDVYVFDTLARRDSMHTR